MNMLAMWYDEVRDLIYKPRKEPREIMYIKIIMITMVLLGLIISFI